MNNTVQALIFIVIIVVLLITTCERSENLKINEHFLEQEKLKRDSLEMEYKTLQDSLLFHKNNITEIRDSIFIVDTLWREREIELSQMKPSEAFELKDSITTSLGLRSPDTDSLIQFREVLFFNMTYYENIHLKQTLDLTTRQLTETEKESQLKDIMLNNSLAQNSSLKTSNTILENSISTIRKDNRRNLIITGTTALVLGLIAGKAL